MKNALVVGRGYAGSFHGQALKKLGFKVRFYDTIRQKSDFSSFEDALKTNPEVITFSDTPKSRIEYLSEFKDRISAQVFLEKPPCRLQDLHLYQDLLRRLEIIPIHNYLFMDFTKQISLPLRIFILRRRPHQSWYPSFDLTGGGICCDHAYHWLYVADSLGINIEALRMIKDTKPIDKTVIIWSNDGLFNFFATWNWPERKTIINNREVELRTGDNMVESYKRLYTADEDCYERLRQQSLKIIKFLGGGANEQ